MATTLLLAACGEPATPAATSAPPRAGVMVLSLKDGSVESRLELGGDPVAVAVSPDGGVAYVSDNKAGKVYALQLPDLKVRWVAAVGGRPGPILAQGDAVWVSLYEAGAVIELDPAHGATIGRRPVGPGAGQLALLQGEIYAAGSDGAFGITRGRVSGARGFGLAAVAGALWAADYERGEVIHVPDNHALPLPKGLHPFWLAPGSGERLLIAAEGDDEDKDAGAVLAIGPPDYGVRMLLQVTDPDLVAEAGGSIYVASHGARQVDVLKSSGERAGAWAKGAAVVALAVDGARQSLLVVTDEGE